MALPLAGITRSLALLRGRRRKKEGKKKRQRDEEEEKKERKKKEEKEEERSAVTKREKNFFLQNFSPEEIIACGALGATCWESSSLRELLDTEGDGEGRHGAELGLLEVGLVEGVDLGARLHSN